MVPSRQVAHRIDRRGVRPLIPRIWEWLNWDYSLFPTNDHLIANTITPVVADRLRTLGFEGDVKAFIEKDLKQYLIQAIQRAIKEKTMKKIKLLSSIIQMFWLDKEISDEERKQITRINMRLGTPLTRAQLDEQVNRVENGEKLIDETNIAIDSDLRKYISEALGVEENELELKKNETLRVGRQSRKERLEAIERFLRRSQLNDLYDQWAAQRKTTRESVAEEHAQNTREAPRTPGAPEAEALFRECRKYYEDDLARNTRLIESDLDLMEKTIRKVSAPNKGRVLFIEEEDPRNSELYVVGDLHGSLCNLEALLSKGHIDFFNRVKERQDLKLIFLGDYVDRGKCSSEVIRLVCSLKVKFPDNVFMLQGNHDTHFIQEVDGKKVVGSGTIPGDFHELYAEYTGIEYFEKLIELEKVLPVAIFCKIGDQTILFCHGGIVRPSDIGRIHEREDLGEREFADAIIWSDPHPNAENAPDEPGEPRFHFGRRDFEEFMGKLNADLMIRGHEPKENGYEAIWDTKLITVFSAGGLDNFCDGGAYDDVRPAYLSITWDQNIKIQPNKILYQGYSQSYEKEYLGSDAAQDDQDEVAGHSAGSEPAGAK